MQKKQDEKTEKISKEISKKDIDDFFESRKLVAVLIRSYTQAKPNIRKTLELLKLTTKNSIGFYNTDTISKGMIRRVKDYITFGEVDSDFINDFVSKNNPIKNNKKSEKYISYIFNMQPPIGGYGRKGIKTAFVVGGALGNRDEKIKDLIKKMIR